MAAATPPPARRSRAAPGSIPAREGRSASCAVRNQKPAPAALKVALRRLVRQAYSPTGIIPAQTWARVTKNGVPGGWGIPRIFDAAISSPASQKVTDGARVAM
jgi:hypothetical protein